MNRIALALLLMAAAAFGGELTGKWSGLFQTIGPDGAAGSNDSAYMVLKLAGQTVTGTAGPNEGDQRQISKGKLDGKKLTFEIELGPGMIMKFDLTFDGETIKGTAAAERDGQKMAASLDLKRKE